MTDNNYNILIENIETLMRNKNINQATLIRETGIPQSQMSKALNRSQKNQFTFEQIWAIADYFKVTIDSLVGRKADDTKDAELSNKEICKIMMRLIESESINYTDVEVEEDMYTEVNWPTNGYPYEYSKGKNTYRMFFFANYLDPDVTNCAQEQLDELEFDFSTQGNLDKKHREINDFFVYYFKLYDLLKHNDLEREIFDQAISAKLETLKH